MRNYLQRYALERDISPGYVSQIRYSLDRFTEWFGKSPDPGDLADEIFNRWLVAMQGTDLSKQTVKTYRRHLLTLWRAAFEDGVCEHEPRRVRKIKADLPAPQSPSPAELHQMLVLSQKITGVFKRSRVNKAAFWRAFFMVAWDTGLRLGDLLRLKPEQIQPDGSLVVIQHKTGWPIPCWLQPETVAAVHDTFPPARPFIFGGCLCKDQVMRQFRVLRSAAGIATGGTKIFRKASATAVEIQTPGGAMAHLGHKTPGLAYRHYVDLTKVQANKPRPPKLA